MIKNLKYISISHKTATVTQREKYHIADPEKEKLSHIICEEFPDIAGMLILATCNRTEIYFESTLTSALDFRDFFIRLHNNRPPKSHNNFFKHSDKTEETVKHLLEVASGLESSVLGDAEIIHQIKKAYQFSISHKLQGSILERALQSVFKSHKRISNETHFRDGTTSIAYKALKVVRNVYGKTASKNKKMLFIGAGDIVKQLFKYNSKFNFKNIHLSNRTQEKAKILSENFKCSVYDWEKVIANDFENFDVIISAASNCHHLITTMPKSTKKILLIDLAIPSNIDKSSIARDNIIFYDLDLIASDLEKTKEKRLASINEVELIILEEFEQFKKWVEDGELREFLLKSKLYITKKIKSRFMHNYGELDQQTIQEITNKVLAKLVAQNTAKIEKAAIDKIIIDQLLMLHEPQT